MEPCCLPGLRASGRCMCAADLRLVVERPREPERRRPQRPTVGGPATVAQNYGTGSLLRGTPRCRLSGSTGSSGRLRPMSALPDELPGRTRPPVHPVRVVLALLVVAAAAVGLLPDLLGLDGRSPFAQLAAFRPTLLAGVLVLAVGATVAAGVRKRGWTLAVGLLAVAAVGIVMVAPRALAGVTVPEPDAPTRPALTVLTLQHLRGPGGRRRPRRADPRHEARSDRPARVGGAFPGQARPAGAGLPVLAVAGAGPRRAGGHGGGPRRPG